MFWWPILITIAVCVPIYVLFRYVYIYEKRNIAPWWHPEHSIEQMRREDRRLNWEFLLPCTIQAIILLLFFVSALPNLNWPTSCIFWLAASGLCTVTTVITLLCLNFLKNQTEQVEKSMQQVPPQNYVEQIGSTHN